MTDYGYRQFRVSRWFWFACWRWGGWFRLFGRGLHLRKTIPGEYVVFSERYGYTKVWKFASWRLMVLK